MVPVCAQETPIALAGARILTIAGPEIQNGVLVVQSGRIVAVGPMGAVTVPPAAKRIDVAGKIIMPGLIDTHSHIGSSSYRNVNPHPNRHQQSLRLPRFGGPG